MNPSQCVFHFEQHELFTKKIKSMSAFIKFLLIAVLATAANCSVLAQNVRAVWMYDFNTWKGEPNFGGRIQSASAYGFNTIYLGVLSDLLDETDYGGKMDRFVSQAKLLNIEVQALTLQDPHFSLAYKHEAALGRIQEILDYNIAHPDAAFSGIHIDPEPHILLCENDESHTCNTGNWESLPHVLWTTPPEITALAAVGGDLESLSEPMKSAIKTRRAGIMTDFNTLLQRIRNEKINPYNVAHDPDIVFSSTVGWWYNEKRTGVTNGYLSAGATTLMAYLDYIVPMVYSGGVGESVSDIVSRVDDEIREANAPTVIGISHESLQNFPGGVAAAFDGLEMEFEGDPAFGGVAVFKFSDLPVGTCPVPLFAQCGLHLNNSPIPGGTYQALPGAILTASAQVNFESNTPVVFRASNAIELQPGFEVVPDLSVDFHAHIQAQCLPLLLETETFEDNDYPDVQPENYLYAGDFDEPFASNIPASGNGYIPGMSNRYFISIFGPRYKDVSSSNSNFYDFHTGEDMVDGSVVPEGDPNNPTDPNVDIKCRCTGVVEEVEPANIGEGGRWVKVRCDQAFRKNGQGPDWGNIFMAYRHLLNIANNPATGQMWAAGNTITKGAIIGKMGASGVTVNNHLHHSIQRKDCDLGNTNISKGAYVNVHALRTFNPAAYPHLLEPLDGAEIRLLDYSENTALLRIALPYNQFAVRAIRVSLPDGSYTREVDFEKISAKADDETQLRDDPEFIKDLRLFPMPYNHGLSAYQRYFNELNDSPGFPPGYPCLTYPIQDEGIFQTPAYVLDIRAENLPDGFCVNDLRVSVIDIWGNGVKTLGNHPPQVTLSFKDPVYTNPPSPLTRYLADDALFFENSETLQVEASAFDSDGSVSQVDLFINGSFHSTDASTPFVFSVPASGLNAENELVAVARDNQLATTSSNTLTTLVTAHEIFTTRVDTSPDDAEENKLTGTVAATSSFDLDLCFDAGSIRQFVGVRCTSVAIPQNAVIEKAYLQFTAKAAGCGATNIHIYGQDTDNAPVFVGGSGNYNISLRTLTSSTVTWPLSSDFDDCWRLGEADIAQRTPDLSNIVQEIIDRPGWASGNNMVFVLENNDIVNRRQAYAFTGCGQAENQGEKMAPRLIVEYLLPGNKASDPTTRAFGAPATNSVMKLYPNPTAANELFVEISGMLGEGDADITISNLSGQVISLDKNLQNDGVRFKLDIADLAPGVYILRIKTAKQSFTDKFIRQ